MSTLRRAGRNIFFKTVAEVFSRLIYLVFFIFMARKLGASDFGLFSFAFSFAGIFVILIDPGFNILITRDVAMNRALTRHYTNNIFTIKAVLSVGALLLLWLLSGVLGYDDYTIKIVLIMGIFLMMNCFFDFFVAVTDAHERMDIGASIKVMNKLLISLLGGASLFLGVKMAGLISWMNIASAISIFFAFLMLRKLMPQFRIEFDAGFLKSITCKALPLALTMIFSTVYFKIDVVMLSLFKVSSADIGLYSASVKFIEVLNIIPAVLVGGIFPILSKLSGKSTVEFDITFRKSFQVLMLLAIPIVVTAAVLSKGIIGLLYGNTYAGSANALSILIWTSLFIFPNFLLLNIIVIANRQKLNAVFTFICLCLNVILNIFLIPRYGFIGASIATVITDALLFILTSLFAVKYFRSSQFLLNGLKPVVCGAVLAVILAMMREVNIMVVLPVSIASYIFLVLATKALTIKDIELVKQAFAKG